MITYDDFKKIELKTAKIILAERVPNSEKLIRLEIDLGEEKRQIVAGIGKIYEPENLIGRTIIIVANLEPKMLMGLSSQGMLLAAHGENGPALLIPDQPVPPGASIS